MNDGKKIFRCRTENHEPDEGKAVRNYDPVDAACEYAEWHDSQCSEYPSEQVIFVVDPKGVEHRVVVTAEPVRQYRGKAQAAK